MNNQRPENENTPGLIRVHSVFRTIQAEGPYAGRPSVFVRLHGCNLMCKLCDTDYTSSRHDYSARELVDKVRSMASNGDVVVVTGGEPLIQDIAEFVNELSSEMTVQIETNGTVYGYGIDYSRVCVICSPKTPRVSPMLWPHIGAYKYIVDADCESYDNGIPSTCLGMKTELFSMTGCKPVYLQPCDYQDEEMNARSTARAVELCMEHGHTLSIQINKLAGLK